MTLQVDFGAPQTGIGYRFYDASGAYVGARITTGINAAPQLGPGIYLVATAAPPNSAVGVYWDCANAAFTAAALIGGNTLGIPPGAPTDLSLCRVYGYLELIDNRPAANVAIKFTLIATAPTKSERLISGRFVRIVTDSQGRVVDADGNPWLDLQRNDHLTPTGTKYALDSKSLGFAAREITLTTDTFDLSSLVS